MKILFAFSGSGGHIFPALSVARSILSTSNESRIAFLTEKNRITEEVLASCEFEVFFLEPKLSPTLQPVTSIIKLLMTSLKSVNVVTKFRPDVIVGFGGYVSIIPIVLSKFLRLKSLIHEQNVIFGKTNRFLCSFVQKIAVSFKQTQEAFKGSKTNRKIVYTGLPIRSELKIYSRSEAACFFGLDSSILTILVMGGSLGARTINKYFLGAVRDIRDRGVFQIIHICGFKDEVFVRAFYKERPNLRVKVFPFLKDIAHAFSLTDFCICRSGASTIYELSFFKVPAILIPYPYVGRHQFANAEVLSEPGACVLLDERYLSGGLKEEIEHFLNKREELLEMKKRFPSDLNFGASETLSDIITAQI